MDETISASELEEYAYCPLAWYLHRSGAEPRSMNISTGILYHGEEQRKALLAQHQMETANKAYVAGILLLLLALLLIAVRLWSSL